MLTCSARAYYLSSQSSPENLERAEECIKELSRTLDTTQIQVSISSWFPFFLLIVLKPSSEHQQALWMRVAVMKRRDASVDEFVTSEQNSKILLDSLVIDTSQVFLSIIETCGLGDKAVQE
jgi:hypothetical protein